MDEDRRRYWQAYVDELRQLMELRDWEVRLEAESTEAKGRDNALAHIECTYGRKLALLHVSDTWEDHPPEDHRRAVAHELVHCHLTGAADTVMDGMLTMQLGEAAYAILRNAFLRHLEYGVDAIAQAWAESLPLPAGDHSVTEQEVEQLFDLEPGEVTRGELTTAEELRRAAPE